MEKMSKKRLFPGKGPAVRSQAGSWKHNRSAWLERCMTGLDTEQGGVVKTYKGHSMSVLVFFLYFFKLFLKIYLF